MTMGIRCQSVSDLRMGLQVCSRRDDENKVLVGNTVCKESVRMEDGTGQCKE
jgi:hypothetical protein